MAIFNGYVSLPEGKGDSPSLREAFLVRVGHDPERMLDSTENVGVCWFQRTEMDVAS
jgi:hypothetical protein